MSVTQLHSAYFGVGRGSAGNKRQDLSFFTLIQILEHGVLSSVNTIEFNSRQVKHFTRDCALVLVGLKYT
jgi:hypothetical protein